MVAVLGDEKAAELLAALPPVTAAAPLEQSLSAPPAARATHALRSPVSGKQPGNLAVCQYRGRSSSMTVAPACEFAEAVHTIILAL